MYFVQILNDGLSQDLPIVPVTLLMSSVPRFSSKRQHFVQINKKMKFFQEIWGDAKLLSTTVSYPVDQYHTVGQSFLSKSSFGQTGMTIVNLHTNICLFLGKLGT